MLKIKSFYNLCSFFFIFFIGLQTVDALVEINIYYMWGDSNLSYTWNCFFTVKGMEIPEVYFLPAFCRESPTPLEKIGSRALAVCRGEADYI